MAFVGSCFVVVGSARYQKLFERRAVWREDEGPINLFELGNDSESIEGQSSTSDPNCVTFSTGPGAKKKLFSDEGLFLYLPLWAW